MTDADSLRGHLIRRIRHEGPLTFADFMSECLYHPSFGRYSAPVPPMGAQGDYLSSPEIDPAFGRLVGRAVAEMAARIAPPPDAAPFRIVECGPGRGSLARDLLGGWREEIPELLSRTRYVLVETSAALRAEQRSVLGSAGMLERVEWADWSSLLEEPPFAGVVLANEFLDALPVHLVEQRDGKLREVFVGEEKGELGERLGDPSSPAVARYFDDLPVRLAEGHRAEVNLAAVRWIGEAARMIGRGCVLVIDYGHEAIDLFDERHSSGTLVGYRRHRLVVDPFQDPGGHDLTSHVDLTSVARAGLRAGFDARAVTTQRRLLVAMGLAEMIAELGATSSEGAGQRLARRFALHALMMPEGMGEIFKVMVLSKGVSLEGLASLGDPFREIPAGAPVERAMARG